MAGIYLHIPFCKKACYYCDFHFSTNTSYIDAMVRAISRELKLQKNYLKGENINTIYFGGGTPSLLNKGQIDLLLSEIYAHFKVTGSPEITMEANPDDLTGDKVAMIKSCGINRLSIGIQSFDDRQLSFMNRVHTAREAIASIGLAKSSGIDNITIDLIYGLPGSSLESWKNNLEQALALEVPHVSAYCLTIEPGTVFGHRHKNNKLNPLAEDIVAQQFEAMVQVLSESGYVHYEVSNFCLPGMYSQHNSNYWKYKKYLGVGPGAHSFDLVSRQANIRNNHLYISAIEKSTIPCQVEKLTSKDKANEYLLTSLRTHWGCDLHFLKSRFKVDFARTHRTSIDKYKQKGLMTEKDGVIVLTTRGMLVADSIIQAFFIL